MIEELFERQVLEQTPDANQREKLLSFGLKEHLWLATSGTSSQKKWVALSKEALFSSAEAVNTHLGASHKDVWLVALPTFHVGGLGMIVRAYLSGASLLFLQGKWDPVAFTALAEKATLTALVPTQVFDLVSKGLKAPKSLRGCIVGGAALSLDLYKRAKELLWPCLPSFGLTECSSQVATACLDDPSLKLLPHVQAKVVNGYLQIKSQALLTGYVVDGQFIDPKCEGWFQTEDLASLDGSFKVLGRGSDWVKINGEGVSLIAIEQKLNLPFDSIVIAPPDERRGHILHLVTTAPSKEALEPFLLSYHAKALSFERIDTIHFVDKISRSPLGKPLRSSKLFVSE